MRARFWCALAAGLALFALAGPADAQFIIDHETSGNKLRGLHGPTAPRIRRSFESDREASTTFREILAATGIPGVADRIQVRASAETANAEAQIGEDGQRYIFYNSTFMRELGAKTQKYWALVFVIAHEVGHHIAGHLDFAGQNHRVELEADRYAGFILGRMGASHDEAIAAVGAIGAGAGSDTHPPRDQRVQIVSLGWNDGVGMQRSRPEPSPPAPGPSARTSPPLNPPSFAEPRPKPTPQPSLPPQAAPPAPRSTASLKPPTTAPATPADYAFRVHTRLEGDIISTLPAADVDACRKACDETIGCIGYQFGGLPPLTSACQIFSAVNKRTVDTRWRSGIHSNLALSLPVAYDQGTPALPAPKANPAAPPPVAVKSVVAPLRFGYKTRTHALVVGDEIKKGPADQPLGCLLMCMNTRLCTVASFSPTVASGEGAGQGGTCTAYGSVTKVEENRPDGQTVIFKE